MSSFQKTAEEEKKQAALHIKCAKHAPTLKLKAQVLKVYFFSFVITSSFLENFLIVHVRYKALKEMGSTCSKVSKLLGSKSQRKGSKVTFTAGLQ